MDTVNSILVRQAIAFLKEAGYLVIRKERVQEIGATCYIDETVLAMRAHPPDDYVEHQLAVQLAHELPKHWEMEVKHDDHNRRREYRVTVMVVKPNVDASSRKPQA